MLEEFLGKQCVVTVARYSDFGTSMFNVIILAYDEKVIKVELLPETKKQIIRTKMIIPMRHILSITMVEKI